jgi:hypothetical protein
MYNAHTIPNALTPPTKETVCKDIFALDIPTISSSLLKRNYYHNVNIVEFPNTIPIQYNIPIPTNANNVPKLKGNAAKN